MYNGIKDCEMPCMCEDERIEKSITDKLEHIESNLDRNNSLIDIRNKLKNLAGSLNNNNNNNNNSNTNSNNKHVSSVISEESSPTRKSRIKPKRRFNSQECNLKILSKSLKKKSKLLLIPSVILSKLKP